MKSSITQNYCNRKFYNFKNYYFEFVARLFVANLVLFKMAEIDFLQKGSHLDFRNI